MITRSKEVELVKGQPISEMKKKKTPTKIKAKKMLKDGKARGKKLTKKQRGLFGAIVGGNSKKY